MTLAPTLAPLLPSPMLARPDTSATLACEDRGFAAILSATSDDHADTCIGDTLHTLYPSVTIGGRLVRATLSN